MEYYLNTNERIRFKYRSPGKPKCECHHINYNGNLENIIVKSYQHNFSIGRVFIDGSVKWRNHNGVIYQVDKYYGVYPPQPPHSAAWIIQQKLQGKM